VNEGERPTDADADAILANHYALRETGRQILDTANINVSWRVTAGAQQYVLKYVFTQADSRWLAFQEQAIDHRVARDFPIQPLLPTLDRRMPVRTSAGYWQLRPFAEGRAFDLGRDSDRDAAAQALWLLHQTPPVGPADAVSPHYDFDDWVRFPETTLRSTLTELSRSADRERLRQLGTLYNVVAREALTAFDWAQYSSLLPRRVTHGDLHGQNLLFNNDRLTCILDWDGMGIRPRILDVAKATFFLARRGRGEFHIVPLAAARFVSQYEPSGLAQQELVAFIPILQLSMLPSARYLELLRTRAPDRISWYLEWSAAALSSMRPNLEALLEALSDRPLIACDDSTPLRQIISRLEHRDA